ncbi:MAG: sulfatase [Myxococcota bacterium]
MSRRLLDQPWLYFTGAGLLLLVAIVSQFEFSLPAREEGKPEDLLGLRNRDDLNVVFIVVDTMRADHLSSYGYERETTPNMDTLGRYGIRFADVIAQSTWTKASMASLWTGAYPSSHGILRFNHVMPSEALMPAEILREAGLKTAGIWRNGWVAPNFGFSQGFDIYLHPTPGAAQKELQRSRPGGGSLPGSDEDVAMASFEFIDTFGHEPFFLYVHLMDLHQYVYDQSAPHFGSSYLDAYDAALNWSDRVVGLIVNHLQDRDLLDETVIVITSDHGEAFQEHGNEGHARNLYKEVIQVPWIVSLPFALDPGIVIEERVENVDVWPTLLDLLGLPPLLKPDGRSLLPTILASAGVAVETDPETDRRPTAISQLDRYWGQRDKTKPLVAVVEGPKRLMWWADDSEPSELYDTDTDPGERNNLYDPDSEESQRLRELARQYYESGESPWGVEPIEVEIDELMLNQLRALGYEIGR